MIGTVDPNYAQARILGLGVVYTEFPVGELEL